jgi:hypothetical protein
MSSRLALALSATALVVALLGSTPIGHALVSNVPRNSVGPLQLKRNAVGPQKLAPNAVRAPHVLNGSLLAEDFKSGQLPAGPPGPAGPAGPAGPPGLSQRQVVAAQSPNDSNSPKIVTAICPAGRVAVGGGGRIDTLSPGPILSSTRPEASNAWYAQAYEVVGTAGNWRLSAYVVCARVG